MLVNPVYCGDIVWNRRTLARFFKIGPGGAEERLDADLRRTANNPKGEWIVMRDTHERLVSRDAWFAAQVEIQRRSRLKPTAEGAARLIELSHAQRPCCGDGAPM